MSLNQPVIAIAGSTGVVGNEMLRILEERKVSHKEIKIFASSKSAGELYSFADQELQVEELKEDSFQGVDIALFATSSNLSEKFVPIAVESGAIAIDNSSFFRMDPKIPLVVPEVNPEAIKGHKVIANPNCSTIQLVPILKLIEETAGLKRVVVSTYQAVSGAGKAAIDELFEQVGSVMNQTDFTPSEFQHQIAFNCIPQIDVFADDDYTKEELKVINESRKILDLPDLLITCTAVRVPVFNSHAESVSVETEKAMSPEEFIKLCDSAEGIQVASQKEAYPLQIGVSGQDDLYVGRVRKDNSVENGLNLWIVGDNIRKGAALNAVQIAELLISR